MFIRIAGSVGFGFAVVKVYSLNAYDISVESEVAASQLAFLSRFG